MLRMVHSISNRLDGFDPKKDKIWFRRHSPGQYGELSPIQAFKEARGYAHRALELDPELGAARASIAAISLFHDWDFTAVESDFGRAVELAPSEARTRLAYADLLAACARHNEAVTQIQEAVRLTPLLIAVLRIKNFSIRNVVVSPDLYIVGAFDERERVDGRCELAGSL